MPRKRSTGAASAQNLEAFKERLIRRWSVETGIIERIYDVDRGLTELLVEDGFVEDLVTRTSTDTEPSRLIAILQDHQTAFSLLMTCVEEERELTVGFVHQLHQALTLHQDTVTAYDQFGGVHEVPLLKGAYKTTPNNPSGADGLVHQYCPPLQVAPQMERLVSLLEDYRDDNPIVVAAWLHHRFTQIHPYQDGNGRVARALTAVVLLRAGLLPFPIDRAKRDEYITALEEADTGDLTDLIQFFAEREQEVLLQALSITPDVEVEARAPMVEDAITSLGDKLRRRQQLRTAELGKVNDVAVGLRGVAQADVDHAMQRLESVVLDASGGLRVLDRFVQVGGPAEGTAHYYKREVIRSAQDALAPKADQKFVNFERPHYFVKGTLSVSVEGAANERLVFVASFHHIGRADFGVMEATAFAQIETRYDLDGESRRDFEDIPCSSAPFVFSFDTNAKDAEGGFIEWLNAAMVVAIRTFSLRL